MSTKKARPEFTPRAIVAQHLGSKAITPAGIARATTEYSDDQARTFALEILGLKAREEMDREMRLRKQWLASEGQKAWFWQVPDYARYAIFGNLMPERIARRHRALRGVPVNSSAASNAAYKHCKFPARARNCYSGDSNPGHYALCANPGYRSETFRYKGSYSKYQGEDRYADYACVASGDTLQGSRHVFVAFPDGSHGEGEVTNRGSWRAAGVTHIVPWGKSTPLLTPAQRVRVLRRLIASRGLSSVYVAEHDGKLAVIDIATGEWYHGDLLLGLLDRAIAAFAQRERERRQAERNERLDALIAARGERIFVGVQDSLSAGNCETNTLSFAARHSTVARVAPDLAVMTASEILAARDDSYTRRACRVAALRYA